MNEETKCSENHADGAVPNARDAVKEIQSLLALYAAEARFTKICTTPAGAMEATGLKCK